MIVRAFNVTIATPSIPNTVNQQMHSDAEYNGRDEGVYSCWDWLAIWKKKENGDRYDRLNMTHHRCIALSNKYFFSFKFTYLKRYTTYVCPKSPRVVQMLTINVESHLRSPGSIKYTYSNFSLLCYQRLSKISKTDVNIYMPQNISFYTQEMW